MTTIKLKNGSGAPAGGDLVQGEPALDLTNKRLYTEDSGGTVIEVGTNPGVDVTFADNRKAVFGAGSDLQIYHDGSNSYIDDAGTGTIRIRGHNQVRLTDTSDNIAAIFKGDAESTLYHNNSAKLATTATGIDVTGGVTTNANSYLNGLRVGGADTGNTIYQPTGDLSISSASGSIFLKPSGTTVLTATSTGIDVTGSISADGLTVSKASGDVATLEGTGTTSDVEANLVFNPVYDVNARIVSAREGAALTSRLSLETGTANDFSTKERLRISGNGDISFYEDTGTTAKLFWDASAESLGIGTSSPSRELHISKAGQNGVRLTSTSFGADFGLLSSVGGTNGFGIYDYNASGYRFNINSSGNVGIGTSSPSFPLEVDGGTGDGIKIKAGNTSNDDSFLVANSSNTTMFLVDGGGNVGIGTSTPQASIHTTGDAIIGTTTSGASYEGVLQIADGAVNGRTAVLIYNNHPDQFMKLGQDVNTAFIGRDQADEFAIGVFDNAADTTLSKQFVIDASGNVLIGKTSSAIAGAGTAILSSGTHNVTVDGDTTLQLNRLSSPGPIATFFADGGTVGSIAAEGGDLVVGTGNVGMRFFDASNAIIPRVSGGGGSDASIDIGLVSGGNNFRFKDLYLSGGAYLGGTAAANKLDDYEEGTFTGAVADASSGGNQSSSALNGTYVKVGAVVYVQFNVSNIITTGMTAGNDVFITGLPFASKSVSGTAKYTGTANLSVVTFEQTPFIQVNEGGTFIKIMEIRSGAGNDSVVVSQLSSGASDIHGNLVYETA